VGPETLHTARQRRTRCPSTRPSTTRNARHTAGRRRSRKPLSCNDLQWPGRESNPRHGDFQAVQPRRAPGWARCTRGCTRCVRRHSVGPTPSTGPSANGHRHSGTASQRCLPGRTFERRAVETRSASTGLRERTRPSAHPPELALSQVDQRVIRGGRPLMQPPIASARSASSGRALCAVVPYTA
jgi:hypothetical protein